jgi:hypothetical protein
MNRMDRLMKALADAESRVDAPRHVEDAVMAAWDRAQSAQSLGSTSAASASPRRHLLAIAASLILVVAGYQAATSRRAPLAPTASERSARHAVVTQVPPATAAAPPLEAHAVPIVDAPPFPAQHAAAPATRSDRRPTRRDAADTTTVVLIGPPTMTDESVRVVRMRVPGSTLSAMGISPAATARIDRGGPIDLDVLVGEDGVARAVRFGM